MIGFEVIFTTLLLLVFIGVSLWITIRSNQRKWLVVFPLGALILLTREIIAIYQVSGIELLAYRSDPLLILFFLVPGFALMWIISKSTTRWGHVYPKHQYFTNTVYALDKATTRQQVFTIYTDTLKKVFGDVAVIVYTHNENQLLKAAFQRGRNCNKLKESLPDNWAGAYIKLFKKYLSTSNPKVLTNKQINELGLREYLPPQEDSNQRVSLSGFYAENRLKAIALMFFCKTSNKFIESNLTLINALVDTRLRNIQVEAGYYTKMNQFATILDHLNYLVGYKDEQGRWKYLNNAAVSFLQLEGRKYYERTNIELRKISHFHEELFSFLELLEIRSWQENRSIKEQKDITFSDDNQFVIELQVLPTYAGPGYESATIFVARDITRQKEIDAALKNQEQQFRDLIMQMPFSLAILSHNNIEYTNERFREIYGYSAKDIKNLDDWFEKAYPDPEYRKKVRMDWEYSLRIKNTRHLYKVFNVTTRNGRVIRTRLRWGYLGDDKVFVLLENITKEQAIRKRDKQTQRNLIRLSQSALELITLPSQNDIFTYIGKEITAFFDKAVVLFNMVDRSSRYGYLHDYFGISDENIQAIRKLLDNDPFEYFFKIKPFLKLTLLRGKLSMLRKGFAKLLEDDCREEDIRKIERIIGGNYMYVIGLVRNGIVYGSMMLITRQKVEAHSFNFVETFMHQASITFHQKELEKELIRAKEQAEESDKLKSAFLANMSHEVRTPMNSIVGFSELLSSADYTQEEKENFVELINDNSRQLMKLITDIVDISKIEAGQISLEYQQVNINKLFENLYYSFKNQLVKREKQHLELRLVKDENNKGFIILTDEYRLKQVLMNLLNNAIKFTNKGMVEFGYQRRDNGNIRFFVHDTGVGIDPMNKEMIFERFRQGTDSELIKNSGTGLGLSISKGLVSLMKGNIWFESLKFKGTTFYVELPLEEVRKPKIEPNQGAPVIIEDWGEKSVLIVEDHQPSYLYMKRILEKTQVNVEHADNARKAVEKIQNGAFYDLILMDIRTPDGNGIEATQDIKNMHPDIKIIAQTAHAMQEDRQRCINAGCDEYLIKPFTKDQLLSLMDKFL